MTFAAVLLLLSALAAGTTSGADRKLDLAAFFSGRTHADNVIKIAFHRPHKLAVDTVGGRNKEGEFVLIDTVLEEGKAARKRTWVMHEDRPGHLTGMLSDAAGPVEAVVAGDAATIRYVMKEGGLKIEQHLRLLGDGSLSNRVFAKKFGLKFAEVDGTIRKLD